MKKCSRADRRHATLLHSTRGSLTFLFACDVGIALGKLPSVIAISHRGCEVARKKWQVLVARMQKRNKQRKLEQIMSPIVPTLTIEKV